MIWQTRRKKIDTSSGGLLMGIINMTPDSFSDGGKYKSLDHAVECALAQEVAGAAVIDVGGESTRPGSMYVDTAEELSRVLPFVEQMRKKSDVLISVDTRKAEVAREVLKYGADIINDVEGLDGPGMMDVCAEYGCGVIVMHMRGTPQTMQNEPCYDDVVGDVRSFFEQRYEEMSERGIRDEQICWDPGIGFGKTMEHNLKLIAHLEDLRVAGRPIMLALSRKKFMSTILEDLNKGRDPLSTAVLTVYGHRAGAQLHRVHDVEECAQALKLVQAVENYE